MSSTATTAGATVTIEIDGVPTTARTADSVAAALANAGKSTMRRSVTGQARAPLCGMGICYECRATVNGIDHRRTCLLTVAEGMVVETAGNGEQSP